MGGIERCYICGVYHKPESFFTALSKEGRKLCSACHNTVQNIWIDEKQPYFSFDMAINRVKGKVKGEKCVEEVGNDQEKG